MGIIRPNFPWLDNFFGDNPSPTTYSGAPRTGSSIPGYGGPESIYGPQMGADPRVPGTPINSEGGGMPGGIMGLGPQERIVRSSTPWPLQASETAWVPGGEGQGKMRAALAACDKYLVPWIAIVHEQRGVTKIFTPQDNYTAHRVMTSFGLIMAIRPVKNVRTLGRILRRFRFSTIGQTITTKAKALVSHLNPIAWASKGTRALGKTIMSFIPGGNILGGLF